MKRYNIKKLIPINILMLLLYTDWLALGYSESIIELIGGLLCAWVATENAL